VRNIFLFIRRYFNFLFFVVIQIIALYVLFHYNKFHEAAFMGVANEVTGNINTRYNNIETYFSLKKTNEALARENEELRNKLKQNFESPDTTHSTVTDSVAYDTLGHLRKFVYRSAKVVNNSVGFPNNYLTIHRGENQGIRKDMGVLSPNGVAGTVIYTSENYAVVMSLLNSQSRVSAKLKKSGEAGQVLWDGKDPSYITMINLPKSVQIAKGDTIVTSSYSSRFPQGIMVGTIADISNDQSSNFYTLKLRTATNFYSVEYVTVVENLQKEEQKKLEETLKTNE
jgi:rod shape-determining protein MreC